MARKPNRVEQGLTARVSQVLNPSLLNILLIDNIAPLVYILLHLLQLDQVLHLLPGPPSLWSSFISPCL